MSQAANESAIRTADAVVCIFTEGWDTSTWMSYEIDIAHRAERSILLWNPDKRSVPLGRAPYIGTNLPVDLELAFVHLGRMLSILPLPGTRRPDADPSRERKALEIFPLAISPDEYAARHAHEWFCFSFDRYTYTDAVLDSWIHRLGDIFFARAGAPSISELRMRYLSVEERTQIENSERESSADP
jgi:hypothetical protein